MSRRSQGIPDETPDGINEMREKTMGRVGWAVYWERENEGDWLLGPRAACNEFGAAPLIWRGLVSTKPFLGSFID